MHKQKIKELVDKKIYEHTKEIEACTNWYTKNPYNKENLTTNKEQGLLYIRDMLQYREKEAFHKGAILVLNDLLQDIENLSV